MVIRGSQVTNGWRKNIGKFPSAKNREAIWYESKLERDFLYHLEYDRGVTVFQRSVEWDEEEKKLKRKRVEFFHLGKDRHYTPDFLVTRDDGRRLAVEVKPETKAVQPKWVALFQAVAPKLQDWGYEFHVVTDRLIRSSPRLENLKLLFRSASTPIRGNQQILCHRLFEGVPTRPLVEVVAAFAARGYSQGTVHALLFHQVLQADLDQPFGLASEIRYSGRLERNVNLVWPWQVASR